MKRPVPEEIEMQEIPLKVEMDLEPEIEKEGKWKENMAGEGDGNVGEGKKPLYSILIGEEDIILEDPSVNEQETMEDKNDEEPSWKKRNSKETLLKKEEDMEKLKDTPERIKAMMWLRKLTLLNQVPEEVTNELLENLDKLKMLEGENMSSIKRKLKPHTVSLGFQKKLKTGLEIRYFPVSHLLLAQLRKRRQKGPLEIQIYWDGFKRFRAKGGSVGLFFSFSFLSPCPPPSSRFSSSFLLCLG